MWETWLLKNESFQNQIINRISDIQTKTVKIFQDTSHCSHCATRISIRWCENHENNECQKIWESELCCWKNISKKSNQQNKSLSCQVEKLWW